MRSFLSLRLSALLFASASFILSGCGDPDPPAAVCGDAVVDAGEVCDDGNTVADDGCRADCKGIEECGDGLLDDGLAVFPEECDDGNTTDGDGCDSFCEIEIPVVCGDGLVDFTEGCDDGDTTAGDGCDGTCNVEVGFGCSGEPSVCVSLAGLCAAAGTANLGDNNGDNTTIGGSVSDAFEPDPLDPTGDCGFGGPGQEQLFVFTSAANGTATVTVTPTVGEGGDPVLYARTNCATDVTDLDCSDVGLGDDPETITFAVTANTAVTLFVDSFVTSTFVLNIAVQ